jgi:hypothetical protein
VTKIFQSYIGAEQRSFVSPGAIPFDALQNSANDGREYDLFKLIRATRQISADEPWGLLSWKFQHKSLVSVADFAEFCDAQFRSGADCVFINPMIGNEALFSSVWEQAMNLGPPAAREAFKHIYSFLQESIGSSITFLMGARHFAFCNYFVAKDHFWAAYFNFVDDAVARLEAEARRKTPVGLAYETSGSYDRDVNLTMKPFVVERLFSSFLVHPSCSFECRDFGHPLERYLGKFGEQLGDLLYKMSRLKNHAIQHGDAEALKRWDRLRPPIFGGKYLRSVLHLDDPANFFLTRELTEFLTSESVESGSDAA